MKDATNNNKSTPSISTTSILLYNLYKTTFITRVLFASIGLENVPKAVEVIRQPTLLNQSATIAVIVIVVLSAILMRMLT